jgi:uncharacterized membrane protein
VSETVHTGISEKAISAISYLTLIPAVLFLAIAPYNRSETVRFHCWQSIIVSAIAFLANFVLSALRQSTSLLPAVPFLILSGLVGILYTIVMIWCAVRALNGKRSKLPLFGAWAERQANR